MTRRCDEVSGRFFVVSDLTASFVDLPREEASHAVKSRRLGPGSRVEIFNGRGESRRGVLESALPGNLSIRFTEPLRKEEAPSNRLCLAVSPPKGGRMTFLVEKLSELGADRLIPAVFRHSTDAGVRVSTAKVGRWRRTAVESAKQCGRSFLLAVDDPCPADALIEAISRFDSKFVLVTGKNRLGGVPPLQDLLLGQDTSPGRTLIVVGPEGGFSPEEAARMEEAGAHPASLGKRILRIETAAISAAALFRAAWD